METRIPDPPLARPPAHLAAITLIALALLIVHPFLSSFQAAGKTYGLTFDWSYLKLFALQAAVALACVSLLLRRPTGLKDLLSRSGIAMPIAAILAWAALSTAWSAHPWAAVQPLIELAFLAAGAIVFAELLAVPAVRRWFVPAYGISAGLACTAYIICHIASAPRHLDVYPFANPNHAAAFALVPLAVGAAYAISAAARRVPPAYGLLGALVALPAASAIIVSRSAAAAAASVGALTLVLLFSLRDRARRIMIEALCALALLLLLWPLIAPESWPHEWIAQQLGARPAMWRGALELNRERPTTGLGLGAFFIESARVYPRDYAAHDLSSGILETAHSLPLHVVAELGLVGLLLAAWLFLQSLNTARRAAINAGHTDRALLRGAVCGALAMLAQALVSTELHYTEVSIHLMLVLAIIAALRLAHSLRPSLPQQPSPRLRLASVAIVLTLFAATAIPGLVSQLHLHQATTAPTDSARINSLRSAARSSWTTPWLLQAQVENLAAIDQDRNPGLAYERTWGVLGALDQVRRIDRLAPNFWITRRLQARLAFILGNLDEAADAIVTYARKDPFDPRAYQLWLAILDRAVAEGKPDLARPREAETLLTEAEQRDTKWLPRELALNFIAQFRRLAPAPSP